MSKLKNSINLKNVNKLILKKQHLSPDSKTDDIKKIVEDIIGLHATGQKTPYLSLFVRMNNFERKWLRDEMEIKRNFGKIRCMRRTVHVLSRDMIPIAYTATKKFVVPGTESYVKHLGVSYEDFNVISQSILIILKGKAMTTHEIKKALNKKSDISDINENVNVSAVINLMCDKALLIRGLPKSGWKSNNHTYHIFNEYFFGVDLDEMNENDAVNKLVGMYVKAFGPVTENDICWWTGLNKTPVRHALKNLDGRITNIEISELRGIFYIDQADEKTLFSKTGLEYEKFYTGHTINLLPSMDPYVMGYKDRMRYLKHEFYNYVFDRSGNSAPTILFDGRIIGVWDFSEKGIPPTIMLYLFGDEKDSRKDRKEKGDVLKEIKIKAKGIGKFISDKDVQVKEYNSMVPLTERTSGSFMSDLNDS